MKAGWHITALLATLGLIGGGVGGFYLRNKDESQQTEQVEKNVELKTDAFSVRLFQQNLAEKPGNVLVAPKNLSRGLLALQDIAGGKTLEELQTLGLESESQLRSAEPVCAALLGMDYNLKRGEKASSAMPLPFSDNVPMALSLFNGMMLPATGNSGTQMVDSLMVSSRTRLLAACATQCRKEWSIAFYAANTRMADFDNASGGMPPFAQMRARGLFRTAQAADGSWKAVALPFKAENEQTIPLVYIGILPAGNAREFGRSLTAEKLTEIRKALADATPEDTLVELPRLELQVLPYDMRDTLRRMGLKALFDTEAADFSALTPDKIHLGAFVHALSVSLIENPGKKQPDTELDYAAKCMSFSRPYIWLITDLATGTPIDFMGLIEEM